MELTVTRLAVATPASRRASSNDVSMSLCVPTPLVKKIDLGTNCSLIVVSAAAAAILLAIFGLLLGAASGLGEVLVGLGRGGSCCCLGALGAALEHVVEPWHGVLLEAVPQPGVLRSLLCFQDG